MKGKFGIVTTLIAISTANLLAGLFMAIPFKILCSTTGTVFPLSEYVSWCAGLGLSFFAFITVAEQWRRAFDRYQVFP
jgi:hypothetical protein